MESRPTRHVTPDRLAEAADLLRSGGLVVFPTETVYGLGANALDDAAVAGIFRAKGRPQDNPLIVHVARADDAAAIADLSDPLGRALLEGLSPGPATVILPRRGGLAAAVTAGKDTVGIRVPGSLLAREFIAACGVPVAAPSANQSGRPSPTSFAMAWAEMAGRADAVVEGPEADVGLESTILWPEGGRAVRILRPGGVGPDEVRAVLEAAGFGTVPVLLPDGRAAPDAPSAPGTRYRHYSPKAAVRLFNDAAGFETLRSANGGTRLVMGVGLAGLGAAGETHLADWGNLAEYARGLYRGLVEADLLGLPEVWAWLPPASGLGIAVRDRLERAAGRTGA